MKEHGIEYPTLYQDDWALWGNALALRQQAGFPNDQIYVVDTGRPEILTDAAGLAALKNGIANSEKFKCPLRIPGNVYLRYG